MGLKRTHTGPYPGVSVVDTRCITPEECKELKDKKGIEVEPGTKVAQCPHGWIVGGNKKLLYTPDGTKANVKLEFREGISCKMYSSEKQADRYEQYYKDKGLKVCRTRNGMGLCIYEKGAKPPARIWPWLVLSVSIIGVLLVLIWGLI